MAFPFIGSTGFETGVNPWTSSSGALMSFPHYTDLARYGMAPYRGAYCFRIKLAGGTTDQYIQEDTFVDDWDDATRRFIGFAFYLGKDMVFGATDRFTLFTAESAAGTNEVSCGIIIVSGEVKFWWAETGAAAITTNAKTLGTTTTALGRWYYVELNALLDAAAGTIDGYVDDVYGIGVSGTQVASLAQSVIVHARMGVLGPDAGTSGTVLIDEFIYDDTGRVFPPQQRYRQPNVWVYNAADHPILGPGAFSAALTGTGTNAVLTCYDTDSVPINLEPIAVIRNLTANEMVPSHDIIEVRNGLYTVLSGTAAQAFISIEKGGLYSDGQVITAGAMQGVPRR